MSLLAYPTLLEKLRSKAYRRAFRSAFVRNYIALQIRALRKVRFDSQAKLAKACGKATNVITRLENPNYGKMSVSTMIELADAFDVGLSIKFVPFGVMAAEAEDLSDDALMVHSFDDEIAHVRPSLFADVRQISPASASDYIRLAQMQLGNVPVAAAETESWPPLGGVQPAATPITALAGGETPRAADARGLERRRSSLSVMMGRA